MDEAADFQLEYPNPGTKLGSKYELGDQIGRGAMGVVHELTSTNGDQLAVKLLRPELARDHKVIAGFLQEREIFEKIRHPNVMHVIDLVAEGTTVGIVMERVTGGDLRERRSQSPIPPRLAMELAEGIAAGLKAIHDADVVHRDLKPANILLTEEMVPKIADFGISRFANDPVVTASRLGTPRYMAPESADDRGAGKPADVYALGLIIFEMIADRAPFQADGAVPMLRAHALHEAPRLGGVPEPLANLVAQMLNKQPEDRPSVAEVGAALATVAPLITDDISAFVIEAPRPDEIAQEDLTVTLGDTGGRIGPMPGRPLSSPAAPIDEPDPVLASATAPQHAVITEPRGVAEQTGFWGRLVGDGIRPTPLALTFGMAVAVIGVLGAMAVLGGDRSTDLAAPDDSLLELPLGGGDDEATDGGQQGSASGEDDRSGTAKIQTEADGSNPDMAREPGEAPEARDQGASGDVAGGLGSSMDDGSMMDGGSGLDDRLAQADSANGPDSSLDDGDDEQGDDPAKKNQTAGQVDERAGNADRLETGPIKPGSPSTSRPTATTTRPAAVQRSTVAKQMADMPIAVGPVITLPAVTSPIASRPVVPAAPSTSRPVDSLPTPAPTRPPTSIRPSTSDTIRIGALNVPDIPTTERRTTTTERRTTTTERRTTTTEPRTTTTKKAMVTSQPAQPGRGDDNRGRGRIRWVEDPVITMLENAIKLELSTTDVCGALIVTVIDRKTKELIRQYDQGEACNGPDYGLILAGLDLDPDSNVRVRVTVRGTESDGERRGGRGQVKANEKLEYDD